MEAFHRNLTARVPGPCTCVHVSRRRPNEFHDMTTCPWTNILEAYHHRNKPNWKQSDPAKWMDPALGPWEMAKLFLPDLGGNADIKNANDMDVTGILNLMHWCNHFTIPLALIKDVRDIRNDKWVHVPKLELPDVEKPVAFDSIENLLKSPQLVPDPDAQKALREIKVLKNASDLHGCEVQVVSELIEVLNNEIFHLAEQLTQHSQTSQTELHQLKQLVLVLENRFENLERKRGLLSLSRVKLEDLESFHNKFVRNLKGIRKEILVMYLLMALCCTYFVKLDDETFFRNECPSEDLLVQFDTKEFDWLDYLHSAKEKFIGRTWLFRDLETVFNCTVHDNDLYGVLIIGDPGSGKSALSAQLVCSRSSSRIIHTRILGYHLCKHSDKNTQIAGKFVRNLADMVARRIPEYGYIVANSSYILSSLKTDCVTIEDPLGCFEQAVLSPLKRLKNVPKENWYVVIDGLDECLTQTELRQSIVHLLNLKLPNFPPWLKLVMTSRKDSSISVNSRRIKKFTIDPEDPRNIADIEMFLFTAFYKDDFFLQGGDADLKDSSIADTEKWISILLRKSQGNFLFVKEMIRYWDPKSFPNALPENMEEWYHNFFQRMYDRKEQFRPVRRVLELLVATFQPLTRRQVFDALEMKEADLEQEYDFQNILNELGHFLRYGVDDTITLYHLSLGEWLTSDKNKNGLFYVSKMRGHERLCDFFFKIISEGGEAALSKYSFTLAQHIAYGGTKEAYVKNFFTFPSQLINSSDIESNRTILHLAATINNTDVLKLLLHHFNHIDSTDIHGMTATFLAAEHGLVNNLALMVNRGANVNIKTKTLSWLDFESFYDVPDLVRESKSKFRGATMLHAAAHAGHLNVVHFLLSNGAIINTVNEVNLTALQTAAEKGHVEVVKALHKAGGVADQTALHHAAKNNKLDVVKYLLEIGVKDECMKCDGSFYWLNSLHRQVRFKRFRYVDSINRIREEESIPQNGITSYGELFDDKHLMYCETTLHAAISSGHNEVVKELISRDKGALACQDCSGRTPLQEAVRRNKKDIVNFLLKEDQTEIHATCNRFQEMSSFFLQLLVSHSELKEYKKDVCHCGYSSLHLAARYGNWEIASNLLENNAVVEAKDCFGATPMHVAACHNQADMVDVLVKFGAGINSKTYNGSTPLHSAAVCGASEVIDRLLYHGAILEAADDSAFTALHYCILYVNSTQLNDYVFDIETRSITDRRGYLAKFYRQLVNNHIKNTNFYGWLDALINLILHGSNLNAVDSHGRTALHLAAANGLADAVNVLLQRKAQIELPDESGQTPLVAAIKNAAVAPRERILHTGKSMFELQKHLRDHEMVVYLLLSSGAFLKDCNHSGESLLNIAIEKNQLLIVQLLLLKGASVKCEDNQGRTPLLTYLHGGGYWVDGILKGFDISVDIEFGEPFNISEFHLLFYKPPTLKEDNLFQQISSDDYSLSRRKGPILIAIENHPLKYRVIDSCLDAEGFTPLHRAAQGANTLAVSILTHLGADQSSLSPHGYDALTLALLHAGNTSWLSFDEERVYRASLVALDLLHHRMVTSGYKIICDSSRAELTLYHLAASRGLVHFIQEIFKDKELHQLDVDCPNKNGITPM
ncbi:serine/threonine-protein phosphatase 6 regulatory ankyrin repeat subunit B-like [Stylophora pistillata]|nr:serine/threonine-protein phosphatase 6 regulatory ankyrin repeat subunit B-like [Stylophora pistillata]